MKRRYLVLLFATFFMFLYIGPVNLLPYDVPSAIVQRPQETNPTLEKLDGFEVATDYDVEIAADGDDCWWRRDHTVPSWTHNTGSDIWYVREYSDAYNYQGEIRFVLVIPSGATIISANLSTYSVQDEGDHDAEIFRIDEVNAASPEGRAGTPPSLDYGYNDWLDFDGNPNDWDLSNVTTIVQNQIDEVGWVSGNYMGLWFNHTDVGAGTWFDCEDYQAAGTNHAYLNISYSEAVEYDSLSIEISSDQDDDWWGFNSDTSVWYVHATSYAEIQNWNGSGDYQYYGQMRFQLNLLREATIGSANLTFYEVADNGGTRKTIIKRINETNVGPLEQDDTKPIPSNITTAEYDGWDSNDYEWSDPIDVTALVQEQIDLLYWASGNYIGFEFTWNTTWATGVYKIEDYQNGTSSNNAYLNITYTGGIAQSAYGENWLTGWSRRQQHNISQTDGTGQNYTVPFYVWNGIGSSWFDAAYVNGYAQPDFDDIRFTMNDGDTELEYQLNATWESEITDYISNDSKTNPAYPVNYPNAVYYNQRTYIARHGPEMDPFITYYDHENKTWGGWYGIGDNSILWELNDGHGPPALFVDDEGYIHAFWGGHAAVVHIQHSKSDSPEDISSWSLVNTIDWAEYGNTYPHLYYDATNDLLHMYARTSTGGTQRFIEYRNSTDKGVTWSDAWYILDMSDAAPYFCAGEMDSTNTTLSLAFKRYPFGQTDDTIYYVRANFTSKTVYNASGYSLGETVTDAELPDCLVYSPPTLGIWSPDVHLDENDDPYLMWAVSQTGGDKGTVMFTYWNGTGWNPRDNISDCQIYVAGHDFIVYDSTNITAFVSEGDTTLEKNMTKYTWDGNTWTRVEAIYEGGVRFPSFSTVPMQHTDEIQVTFGEYIPGDMNTKMWAYGVDGLIQYTWPEHALFYVRVQEELSEQDATIYIYYGNSGASTTQNASMVLDSGNDPEHDGGTSWGAEENAAGYFDPVNYQAPTFDNPDDTDNMYARYKEYNITMYASDQNGYADIDFLKLGFWDDGRSNNYARWRYDSPENTFVEEYDWDDYFELNLTKSEAIKSGDVINCTFVFTVDWSCPDMTDVHIAVTVRDNGGLYDVDDFHFLTWDVETRLDFTIGPVLDDGSGTADRGDYDAIDGITASGTIDYYGSAISPNTGDVDIWISCAEIAGSPWSDTTLDAGAFSVTVDSDDIVGLDTYDFKVVTEGAGSGGSDLSHTTHSDTYIADRLVINIQADDESPDNNVQVDFTLTVIYDYDDTVCTTYQIVISRNSIWWHSFTNANKSLFVDIDSNVAHSYTMSNLTNETTHVLTKFISNTETVTWSAPAITTTTTDSGIFYELFLSLDMWGYLGPLGIVVIGYVLAKKDRGLGLIAFMVQCLIAAQYFALVSATPAYWWHIYIILFGGLFSCVIPLIDR